MGLGDHSSRKRPERRFSIYKEHGVEPPKNFRVLALPSLGVTVHGTFFNCDHGTLALRAPSRAAAYEVANALLGLLSIAYGFDDEPSYGVYRLQELNRLPKPDWSEDRLLLELKSVDPTASEDVVAALCSGTHLETRRLEMLQDFLPRLLSRSSVLSALTHLRESRLLFNGFMAGSYYHFHYSRDRAMRSTDAVEKQSLENRLRFELAFVAAFKAVESLLGTAFLKATQVRASILKAKELGARPDDLYERRHEIFRGLPSPVSVASLVQHFLQVRNAAAAHANATPPAHLMVSADTVYEIQLFVSNLAWAAIRGATSGVPVRKSRLPGIGSRHLRTLAG